MVEAVIAQQHLHGNGDAQSWRAENEGRAVALLYMSFKYCVQEGIPTNNVLLDKRSMQCGWNTDRESEPLWIASQILPHEVWFE